MRTETNMRYVLFLAATAATGGLLFGFDVASVKLEAGGKSAKVTPFMTGFLNVQENKFWGRPAYVLQMPDGALLVSDEQNGAIFRVSYRK